jgi:hypothetical protein
VNHTALSGDSMTDRDWIEVCLSGGELDDAGHVDLDRQLTETPDSLELRIKRLGFLFAKELPRARDVLWLATQHPRIDLGGFAVFRRDEDPEVYEQVRLAWKQLLESSPENSVYREQAARFASHDDPSYAEGLYRDGMSLDPMGAKWPERLGTLLMRRSRCAADAATAIGLAGEAVRAFERAYELESWDFGRHGLQLDIARAAIAAGLLDVATVAAHAVLRDASQFERTWQYGNAMHWGHIVLGNIARLRGDLESASGELALAGRTRGSPQLDSFGPDLELAQSLLDLGRTDAVLDYLTQCKRFWEMDRGALDQWISRISSGERPKLELI